MQGCFWTGRRAGVLTSKPGPCRVMVGGMARTPGRHRETNALSRFGASAVRTRPDGTMTMAAAGPAAGAAGKAAAARASE